MENRSESEQINSYPPYLCPGCPFEFTPYPEIIRDIDAPFFVQAGIELGIPVRFLDISGQKYEYCEPNAYWDCNRTLRLDPTIVKAIHIGINPEKTGTQRRFYRRALSLMKKAEKSGFYKVPLYRLEDGNYSDCYRVDGMAIPFRFPMTNGNQRTGINP